MATVRLTWSLNGRQGGQALDPAQARTRIEMSADGGQNFVQLTQVPGTDPQNWAVTELEPGTYQFRATVIDSLDQESTPVVDAADISPNPPNPVADFTVTVE